MFEAKLLLSDIKDSDLNLRNLRLRPEAPCFKKEYPRDDTEKARKVQPAMNCNYPPESWKSNLRYPSGFEEC